MRAGAEVGIQTIGDALVLWNTARLTGPITIYGKSIYGNEEHLT